MINSKRAAGLSALIALTLVRCDCSEPCRLDADCPRGQICARSVCSLGNRLDVDAALADGSRVDTAAVDRSAGDRAPLDRTATDRRSPPDTTALADRAAADAAVADAGVPDVMQRDLQPRDTARADQVPADATAACQVNGATCDDGLLGPLDPICLEGECVGYTILGSVACNSACDWPSATDTCMFDPIGSNVDVCLANCRCAIPVPNTPRPQVTCNDHSVCYYSAATTTITYSCNSQARCYFDCLSGATCTVNCADDALCRVYCWGTATCNLGTCTGGWQDCGADFWVCHRDCPL